MNPELNTKPMTPSTVHQNDAGVAVAHLEPLGNEVTVFLPEHSGNDAPMRGDV